MKRERADVACRRKMRIGRALELSLQLAFEGIEFKAFKQAYWTFNRLHGEAA